VSAKCPQGLYLDYWAGTKKKKQEPANTEVDPEYSATGLQREDYVELQSVMRKFMEEVRERLKSRAD
jgi:hypothetical protein